MEQIEVKDGEKTITFELYPLKKTDTFSFLDPTLYFGEKVEFILSRKVKRVLVNGEPVQDKASLSLNALGLLVSEYSNLFTEHMEEIQKNEQGTSGS